MWRRILCCERNWWPTATLSTIEWMTWIWIKYWRPSRISTNCTTKKKNISTNFFAHSASVLLVWAIEYSELTLWPSKMLKVYRKVSKNWWKLSKNEEKNFIGNISAVPAAEMSPRQFGEIFCGLILWSSKTCFLHSRIDSSGIAEYVQCAMCICGSIFGDIQNYCRKSFSCSKRFNSNRKFIPLTHSNCWWPWLRRWAHHAASTIDRLHRILALASAWMAATAPPVHPRPLKHDSTHEIASECTATDTNTKWSSQFGRSLAENTHSNWWRWTILSFRPLPQSVRIWRTRRRSCSCRMLWPPRWHTTQNIGWNERDVGWSSASDRSATKRH